MLHAEQERTGTSGTAQAAAPVLRRDKQGGLLILNGEDPVPVNACSCFPWTEPGRYISLRNAQGDELELVEDPRTLKPESRRALEESLAETGFLLEITGIEAMEEEVEIRTWRVQTRQGSRKFQTRLDDWPRKTPSGGLLIRDVGDDLFYIPDVGTLDTHSRELIWAFLD